MRHDISGPSDGIMAGKRDREYERDEEGSWEDDDTEAKPQHRPLD